MNNNLIVINTAFYIKQTWYRHGSHQMGRQNHDRLHAGTQAIEEQYHDVPNACRTWHCLRPPTVNGRSENQTVNYTTKKISKKIQYDKLEDETIKQQHSILIQEKLRHVKQKTPIWEIWDVYTRGDSIKADMIKAGGACSTEILHALWNKICQTGWGKAIIVQIQKKNDKCKASAWSASPAKYTLGYCSSTWRST